MDNLKIKSLTISNYCCFKDITIDFGTSSSSSPSQWTVLMGNNNTGKTSILKAIAQLMPTRFQTPTNDAKKRLVPSAFYKKAFGGSSQEGMSVTAILTDDMKWKYSSSAVSVTDKPLDQSLLIYGYGVGRYPSSTSLSDNKVKPCDTLFSTDTRLVNLEEWLMQLDYAAKNEMSAADNRLYRIKELICGNLFPEIQDFSFESSDELHNYVLFKTKDGKFRYTQLGYGYQSMLSWIVDLCKRMFDAYPSAENPLHEQAVVLVDEIDLHLHPKWQRDIIPYLSAAFPNVQFIVTTHSPLVIQSLTDLNLYILHRDDEEQVCIEKAKHENYSGWTVEEILRETMRLESDIHSDFYNTTLATFNEGINNEDKEKAEEAFAILNKILHPNNPIRRMLELQKNAMEND